MQQLDLICRACFYWSWPGYCDRGKTASAGCDYYRTKYRCRGGLVYDRSISAKECRECARTCKGCFVGPREAEIG